MSCTQKQKAVTAGDCNELPGILLSMITTGPNFKVTPEQFADVDFWQAAVKAAPPNRIFPWPNFASLEDISTDPAYEDSVYGMIPAHDGNYRWRQGYRQSLCWHRAAFTHRSASGRVILLDQTRMIGMKDADGNFRGLSKQLLHTEKMKFADGTVGTKSPVLLSLANAAEFDQKGYMISSEVLDSITKVVDLILKVVGDPTSSSIVVDVMTECDEVALSGLVTADFVKKTAAGVVQTITNAAESGTIPGRYTLTGTGFVTGTVELLPAHQLSLSAYDNEPVDVVIPT